MIICDIISWIWRYLIYSLILGVIGGDKLDPTLGTLASRAAFLWWSTGFARILIQPKFSSRMTLVCTLDPFLSFWRFCWTLNVINRKWTGPEVGRSWTRNAQTWAELMFAPMYFHFHYSGWNNQRTNLFQYPLLFAHFPCKMHTFALASYGLHSFIEE